MSKRLIPVLATVLSACEPSSTLKPFQILDVTPLTQKTNESTSVRVRLDTDPAFLVDYGEPAARMVGQPQLVMGSRTLPLTYLGHGLFEGTVEPLAVGQYTVGVNLGDGREATFATPYVVTAVQPELPVARATYDFTRIEPQVQGRPFLVTITVNVRGQVEGAPPYEGTAVLAVYSGGKSAFEVQLGPFGAGKIQQEVIIDQSGDDFVAKIEDALGEQAFSNAFPVAPSES
ncbi:hypothetical protein CYFUS_005175 [Cystobacter fuscus]|uniref:Lipoprotein n=1 Tax=Cystobacter fuscus TaxID=43 RepID=A0A250J874_9BACT|nr:hypothetical protein [Cystobacter fuscus]ATB39727.1 hypothetical protein CYFUS_005175 [Cystobacter fuscus]